MNVKPFGTSMTKRSVISTTAMTLNDVVNGNPLEEIRPQCI